MMKRPYKKRERASEFALHDCANVKEVITLKKIFLLAAAICFALTSSAFAAKVAPTVGVVIIGGVEFKTDDYYQIVLKNFKPKSGATIETGNDLQTRYKKYWLQRGFIGDQPPQTEDLINFAQQSGLKKIVYVIVSDTIVDKHNSSNHREKARVSVQLDAYLCTPTEVVDLFAASNEQNSKGSTLRARRGAFDKCLKEICATLNESL